VDYPIFLRDHKLVQYIRFIYYLMKLEPQTRRASRYSRQLSDLSKRVYWSSFSKLSSDF